MADAQEPINSVPATSAVPAVDAAVPAAPVADTTSSVVPAVTVVAEPVKAETPVPPATESVLGDAAKPAEAVPAAEITEKKVEAKPEADKAAKVETATEVKPEAATPELPAYEAFTVPEGVTLDKEPLDAFTKILGEIETGKLDHAGMQSKGQALIDLAAKSTADSITRLNDYYVQFHENQKKEWFDAFKKDPEMGGDKLDNTVGLLRDAVEQYAGDAKQVDEFRALMKETGVGNHPAVTRLIYNMQQKINSYTTETGGNRMVPGGAPAPSKVKDYQRFYTGGSQ